jgi:hypothetical protein
METPETTYGDRRRRLRFAFTAELQYRIVRQGLGEPIRGTGEAANISSNGLAFHSNRPLKLGMRLSVSLVWPAKLDNQCMLRLVFEGTVLRTDGSLVAVSIERSEFRTAGKSQGPERRSPPWPVESNQCWLPRPTPRRRWPA